MTETVRVCAFRGVASFPLRVALEQRLFDRHGLAVEITYTGSSDELVEGVLSGAFEIVQASPDNFLASAGSDPPIRVWYGGSSGAISLVLGAGVDGIDVLRGARLAVDAPDRGWAPILLRVLADAGIGADEVVQVATGATPMVFAALVEGRSRAAMLNEPWSTRAVRAGGRVAADHRSVAPRLQTSAGASLGPWLDANRDVAERFLASVVAATSWIRHHGDRQEPIRSLAEHLGADPAEAESLIDVMLDPERGWPAGAAPDRGGVAAWADLRGTRVGDAEGLVATEIHEAVSAWPAAIVLAAGAGSRFGSEPKLVADLDGRPVLQHVLDTLAAGLGLGPVVVVLGEHSDGITRAISWRGETRVVNPTPRDGLSSSLKTGLAALPPGPAGVLIVLGDQPLLRAELIRALLAAPPREGEIAVVPEYSGGGGPNPVLLAREAFGLVSSLEGDTGLVGILAEHPERVRRVAVEGSNPDIDTPADLRAVAARGSSRG